MAIYFKKEGTPRNGSEFPQRETLYGKIRKHLNFDGVDQMVLGIGDCRTGTTAWLAASRRLKFPVFYQPAKAILRCIVANEQPEEVVFGMNQGKNGFVSKEQLDEPDEPKKIVVAKDTIGPHNPIECTLNPLDAYLYSAQDNRGLPQEKLFVNFFVRSPIRIWESWKKVFHRTDPDFLLANFINAAQTERGVYEQVLQLGIPHTVFAQELLQDVDGRGKNHPAQVLKTLYSRAGILLPDNDFIHATTGWNKKGQPSEKSQIIFPKEPPYDSEGIDTTLNSSGYFYVGPKTSGTPEDLTPHELNMFESAYLFDSYNQSLETSAEHLQVKNFEQFYI